MSSQEENPGDLPASDQHCYLAEAMVFPLTVLGIKPYEIKKHQEMKLPQVTLRAKDTSNQ